MNVEEHFLSNVAQQMDTQRYLVAKNDVESLSRQQKIKRHPQHAQHGKQNVKSAKQMCGKPIATHCHLEKPSLHLFKCMAGITVRSEELHRMSAILKNDGCVNDETLGTADSEIRMHKHDAL